MNFSQYINLSNDSLVVNPYCTADLKLSYNYNAYIFQNFILALVVYLDMKYNITMRILNRKDNIIGLTSFLVLFFVNTVMLLFQFVVSPILGVI